MNFLFLLLTELITCLDVSKIVGDHFREQRQHRPRELQSGTIKFLWRPIRIGFVWLNQADLTTQSYVQQLLDISATHFGRTLMVRQFANQSSITFANQSTCVESIIPQKYQSMQFSYDLVFFAEIVHNASSNFIAYAGPCQFNDMDERPIFGSIVWNSYQSNQSSITSDMAFRQQLLIAVHEMTHGLGFISSLYKYYYDVVNVSGYPNPITNDTLGRMILQTPRLVNITQNYFNCSTAQGAYMENQGGEGTAYSHWERSIYMNEFMTGSQLPGKMYVSINTYMLLVDAGYYRLATMNAETMSWGKSKGCSFLQKKCSAIAWPEFCRKASNGCTYDMIANGYCASDQLSDGCSYLLAQSSLDCRNANYSAFVKDANQLQFLQVTAQTFTYNSKCFNGFAGNQTALDSFSHNLTSSCFQFQCNSDGSIQVIINNQPYVCPIKTNITINIQNITGVVQCPTDATPYCNMRYDCLGECGRNGMCLAGVCTCAPGYSGAICTELCTNYRDSNNNCVQSCSAQQYSDPQTKYCLTCSANCASCTYIDQCNSCNAGYWLNSDKFCDPLNLVIAGAGLTDTYESAFGIILLTALYIIN